MRTMHFDLYLQLMHFALCYYSADLGPAVWEVRERERERERGEWEGESERERGGDRKEELNLWHADGVGEESARWWLSGWSWAEFLGGWWPQQTRARFRWCLLSLFRMSQGRLWRAWFRTCNVRIHSYWYSECFACKNWIFKWTYPEQRTPQSRGTLKKRKSELMQASTRQQNMYIPFRGGFRPLLPLILTCAGARSAHALLPAWYVLVCINTGIMVRV